jgi:hypothetical protein
MPNASGVEWFARWHKRIDACGGSVIQKTLRILMPTRTLKKQIKNDIQFVKN